MNVKPRIAIGQARSNCLAALVAACFGVVSLQADEEVRLYDVETSSFRLEYFVPKASLCSATNRWDHILEPIPADLHHVVKIAREHLMSIREVKEPLSLAAITLQQKLLSCGNGGIVRVEQRWWLSVAFRSNLPGGQPVAPAELTVVILLDGTIAEERLTKGTLAFPLKSSGSPQR